MRKLVDAVHRRGAGDVRPWKAHQQRTSKEIASAAAAAKTTAYGMVLADLSNPKACLPPGFSSPVSTALGWVKALGLVVAIVALIRIGVHVLRQQGDGVPDRDDTFDKLINWVVGIFIVAGALAFMSALGLSIAESC